MDRRARLAFLLLVLAQTCHSVEEYGFRLWERLPPARFVSELVALDPATGFAIVNSALVGFGLWCRAFPVGRDWPSARAVAWAWAAVEAANGCAHVALAAAAGGYFPGLATAPLLFAGSAFLAWSLMHRTDRKRAAGEL
jgi:hypothetical protein